MLCINVLMSLTCFFNVVIFCEISVPIVWFASVSCENALEFAANAVPKFETVSSNVASSQPCFVGWTLAPYPRNVAVVYIHRVDFMLLATTLEKLPRLVYFV